MIGQIDGEDEQAPKLFIEIWEQIILFLDTDLDGIIHCSRVCKKFFHLCRENEHLKLILAGPYFSGSAERFAITKTNNQWHCCSNKEGRPMYVSFQDTVEVEWPIAISPKIVYLKLSGKLGYYSSLTVWSLQDPEEVNYNKHQLCSYFNDGDVHSFGDHAIKYWNSYQANYSMNDVIGVEVGVQTQEELEKKTRTKCVNLPPLCMNSDISTIPVVYVMYFTNHKRLLPPLVFPQVPVGSKLKIGYYFNTTTESVTIQSWQHPKETEYVGGVVKVQE